MVKEIIKLSFAQNHGWKVSSSKVKAQTKEETGKNKQWVYLSKPQTGECTRNIPSKWTTATSKQTAWVHRGSTKFVRNFSNTAKGPVIIYGRGHSAYPPGISCILLTNWCTNDSGIFNGLLVQIIEKQQFPFVKKGSLGSDLDYIRLQGKLENIWNIAQKSISTEGFSTIFDG